MDQAEDVAFLTGQQLTKMNAALGLALVDVLCERSDRSECVGKLLIKLLSIRDKHERPVTAEPTQHLLGEHGHRQALAAALRMPEDAETALVRRDFLDGLDGTVDAEDLVIFCEHLAEAATRILEQQEALDQIEEAYGLAGRPEHRLKCHALGAIFLQALPRREGLKRRVTWSNKASSPFDRCEPIEIKQAGDGVAVVPQIVVVGLLHRLREVLPLDKQ